MSYTKICNKCGVRFSYILVIDGKERILNTRKRCLVCSPFQYHMVNKLKNLELAGHIWKCEFCQKDYVYKKHSSTTKRCSNCLVNNKRFTLKVKAVEYKGGKCIRCGYDKCNRALTFHHRDPEQKDFNISGNHCRKWSWIQQELDKCDLLCHNCHCEIHHQIDLDNRNKRLGIIPQC